MLRICIFLYTEQKHQQKTSFIKWFPRVVIWSYLLNSILKILQNFDSFIVKFSEKKNLNIEKILIMTQWKMTPLLQKFQICTQNHPKTILGLTKYLGFKICILMFVPLKFSYIIYQRFDVEMTTKLEF